MNEYIIPIKGVKKKTIYHFSDSHLTEYDELSSELEIEKAKRQAMAWERVREGFCGAYGVPYGEYERQSPKTHFLNLLHTAQSDGDALVLAGDTIDYVNGANLRLVDKELSALTIPYIAVCGNHEDPRDIPDGTALSGAKNRVQTLELDDIIISAFDDSERFITLDQIQALKSLLTGDKPVIIVIHVPIVTKGNEERMRNSGVYYQLNYDGCPEENLEFIKIIKENADNVAAVLAGHLHYADISEVAPGVTQYVTAQGITGSMNKYIIGE